METTAAGIPSGLTGVGRKDSALAREPAISIGALAALVNGALVVLFAFVSGFSAEQQTAILAFATAVVPLLGAIVTRTQVTPVMRMETNRKTVHSAGRTEETV